MESLIRFQSLCAELTDQEFHQFITKTMRSQGRDLFTQSFFNNFKSNPNKITPLTNTVTEIINSRDKKPNQQYLCNKIDQLPSSLIAHSASYLKANDYFNFGKVNRKVYISCYTPFKLHKLSYKLFQEYPLSLSMKRFKSVNGLKIRMKHFNDRLSETNKQMLCADNSFQSLAISNFGGNENNAKTFFDSKIIQNNRIKEIAFSDFGATTPNFTQSVFRDVLSSLSNVEKLFLCKTYISDDHISDDEIKQWLANVKHFGFYDQQFAPHRDNIFARKIIRCIGHNMESIFVGKLTKIDIPTKGFCKLEQLLLTMPNMNVLNAFKDVKTLKRVLIASNQMETIKIFVSGMIKEQLLLQFLKINMAGKYLKDTMEFVENILFDCRNKKFSKYKKLNIVFHCNQWKHDVTNGIHIRTVRLINALNIAGIKQFRLHFRMDLHPNFDKESKEMNEWINDINNMKQNYLIHFECNNKTIHLNVSNIGCIIDGYHHNFAGDII